MTGVFSPKVPKATAASATTPPAIEDTDKAAQSALDEVLRRRGRLSTQRTGTGGAPLKAPTSAAQLFGL